MSNKTGSFELFFEQIKHDLDELELERAKEAAFIGKIYKIAVVVGVIILLSMFYFPVLMVVFLLFFLLLALTGAVYSYIEDKAKKLRPLFKKQVIRPLLNYFYEDVRYEPRQKISVHLLRKSLLFDKKIWRSTGDDYTECRIGKTYVHFSEVQTYGRKDSYFFNGFFIAVKFNKSFKSKTIVVPDSKNSYYRKMRMNLLGKMEDASFVKLEDVVFNREFDVISEDQVESRYLLSTSLMQRILDYKCKVNKDVAFSFIENWLYIAIPTKLNLFEISMAKPVNEMTFIRTSYDYFQLLTGLVNDLDLNTRIWK